MDLQEMGTYIKLIQELLGYKPTLRYTHVNNVTLKKQKVRLTISTLTKNDTFVVLFILLYVKTQKVRQNFYIIER